VVYYNHFDLDSLRQFYSWSSSVNNWKDSLRITYTYNDKFFPNEELLETRVGNSWMNSKKWKFVFSNDLLDEEYEYYWDEFMDGWEYKDFSVYEYNSNQDIAMITDFFWDGFDWNNKLRKTYSYNAWQLPEEILNEYWSFGYNQWANSSLNKYEYDAHGNRELFCFFIWDDENDRWRNFYKEENFWSLFESQAIHELEQIQFNVFPNPACKKVQIVLNEKDRTFNEIQLLIYSNEGRLISSQKFSGSGRMIDLSQLPAGSYHFFIKTEKGIGEKVVLINPAGYCD